MPYLFHLTSGWKSLQLSTLSWTVCYRNKEHFCLYLFFDTHSTQGKTFQYGHCQSILLLIWILTSQFGHLPPKANNYLPNRAITSQTFTSRFEHSTPTFGHYCSFGHYNWHSLFSLVSSRRWISVPRRLATGADPTLRLNLKTNILLYHEECYARQSSSAYF